MPESKRHMLYRTALFQVLQAEYAGRYALGCDQFVYWNARNPGLRLAPDVFVHIGHADHVFPSWKTWEKGAPQLAVEIVSEFDSSLASWEAKLERYQEAGIEEVVRFDPDGEPGRRLRIWDRIEGDLVERLVEEDRSPCETLGLWWHVREAGELGSELLLCRDVAGECILPGPQAIARHEGKQDGLREAARRLVASGIGREEAARLVGLEPDEF